MRNQTSFTNDSGVEYKLKTVNQFLIGVIAEKRASEKIEKPEPPTYEHVYNSPSGEKTSKFRLLTQEIVDSEQATTEDKNLWSSYKAELKAYTNLVIETVNTLTVCRAVVGEPSDEFVELLEMEGLTDRLSKDEAKLMWVVSEVAPTPSELARLKEILKNMNGVNSADVETVADDFRPDVQGG